MLLHKAHFRNLIVVTSLPMHEPYLKFSFYECAIRIKYGHSTTDLLPSCHRRRLDLPRRGIFTHDPTTLEFGIESAREKSRGQTLQSHRPRCRPYSSRTRTRRLRSRNAHNYGADEETPAKY